MPRPAAAEGRLLLRNVLGVLALTFTTPIVMSGLVQFTAGWAHQELSAGPFLALAPIALSAALELPAFSWVDHLVPARSPLLLAVLAGPPVVFATVALAVVPSPLTVIAVQPLVAASFALWYVGQSRMLAKAVAPERQATARTLGSALSTGCGALLAGVIGGQLADAVGYSGLFAALGAVSLAGTTVATVALLRRRRRPAGSTANARTQAGGSYAQVPAADES